MRHRRPSAPRCAAAAWPWCRAWTGRAAASRCAIPGPRATLQVTPRRAAAGRQAGGHRRQLARAWRLPFCDLPARAGGARCRWTDPVPPPNAPLYRARQSNASFGLPAASFGAGPTRAAVWTPAGDRPGAAVAAGLSRFALCERRPGAGTDRGEIEAARQYPELATRTVRQTRGAKRVGDRHWRTPHQNRCLQGERQLLDQLACPQFERALVGERIGQADEPAIEPQVGAARGVQLREQRLQA